MENKKQKYMNVITVDPKDCRRWKYADRSGFEFGDIYSLAQDISKNGQIEPVLLRKTKASQDDVQYEVIAGSRRWKACLEAGLSLKGIIVELSDEEAAIAQIKENQKVSICDYSKGIYYAKVLKEMNLTHNQLSELIGCSRTKLENFLAFEKVPQRIWAAVNNPSRVSSRTAASIYALSQKGEEFISALIDLGEDIRKGIGCRTLEQRVQENLYGAPTAIEFQKEITLPSGISLGRWTKKGIEFSSDIPLNQNEIEANLIQYFEKILKPPPQQDKDCRN